MGFPRATRGSIERRCETRRRPGERGGHRLVGPTASGRPLLPSARTSGGAPESRAPVCRAVPLGRLLRPARAVDAGDRRPGPFDPGRGGGGFALRLAALLRPGHVGDEDGPADDRRRVQHVRGPGGDVGPVRADGAGAGPLVRGGHVLRDRVDVAGPGHRPIARSPAPRPGRDRRPDAEKPALPRHLARLELCRGAGRLLPRRRHRGADEGLPGVHGPVPDPGRPC